MNERVGGPQFCGACEVPVMPSSAATFSRLAKNGCQEVARAAEGVAQVVDQARAEVVAPGNVGVDVARRCRCR